MGDTDLGEAIQRFSISLSIKLDAKGTIIDCSQKTIDILGYEKQYIVGKSINTFIDSHIPPALFEAMLGILKEGEPISVEYTINSSSKKKYHMYGDYSYGANDTLALHLECIEEKEKSDYAVLKETISKDTFIDQIGVGIGIFSLKGKIVYINKTLDKLLSKVGIEYKQHSDISILGPTIANGISEVIDNNQVKYKFAYCFRIKDRPQWVQIRIRVISNEMDMGMITLQKIERARIYETVIQNTIQGIVVEGKIGIVYLNQSACNLLGIKDQGEAFSKQVVDYIDFSHKSKFVQRFFGDNPQNEDYLFNTVQKRSISVQMMPEMAFNGQMVNVYFLMDAERFHDQEGYKEKWEETNRMYVESKEHNRIKTEFFANISHEFRTPINIILSAIQLTGSTSGSVDVNVIKQNVIIRQNCYRLLRLVNNLIETTKIDTGYMNLSLKNFNIIHIVEEITMSVAQHIESKGIEIIFDTQTEERIMACDLSMMESIMLNLLSNATKFTPKGGKISVLIEEEGDDWLYIHVQDTGEGIPIDKQTMIFNRFKQVDKDTKVKREGSGIGLSLVKSFVELQGGEISVESDEGIGSRFTIKMPIYKIDVDTESHYNYAPERVIGKIQAEFSDI